jgi:NTP pyrophosphatase (non-canonical NTP hydrolase)
MERIVHKSRSFEEADRWDIEQHISMTPEERQEVAQELRERVYGRDAPDVRESTGDRR